MRASIWTLRVCESTFGLMAEILPLNFLSVGIGYGNNGLLG
jgi:hypothetical protein